MFRARLRSLRFRRTLLWLVPAVLAAAAATAVAVVPAGRVGPSLRLTGNGHSLRPAGRQTRVGNFPTGAALTKGGRFVWAVDSGHGTDDIRVVNVATGRTVQRLPLPGAYGGIVFAPGGRRAYVSGEPRGDSPTSGPTRGDAGDVIHVFAVDPRNGRGIEREPLALPSTSGGSGRTNSLPPVTKAWPEGLAVSRNGRYLVAALNQADSAAIFDLRTGAKRAVKTGSYPNSVAFDRAGKAYVSNELDGTLSVIDPAAGRVTRTIGGLGGALGDKESHPEGMTVDRHGRFLYVAVASRDSIAQVDLRKSRVVRRIAVGRREGLGTQPVALTLSPRGDTLYSANSGEDALAVVPLTRRRIAHPRRYVRVHSITYLARHRHEPFRRLQGRAVRACGGPNRAQEARYIRTVVRKLAGSPRGRRAVLRRAARALPRLRHCPHGFTRPFRLLGRVPTAAYPTDVAVTPSGRSLIWVAGKGLGAGANRNFVFDGDKRAFGKVETPYGSYVLDKLLGRAGVLGRPSDQRVVLDLTRVANRQARPSNRRRPPAGTPVQGAHGGPSAQIKHVFYIVRENRTYDQVFGSDRRGDGDSRLELFDDNGVTGPAGGITPNAHRLARTFPLLDHLYADSEVSVDGHIITAGAHAIDYVQRATAANYSGRGRAFDFGIYPVTFPPRHFVFDQAARQGISFRNYGEQGAGDTPLGNDGRPTFGAVTANTVQAYPGNLQIGCLRPAGPVGNLATCTQDSGVLGKTGTVIGANSRFNVFRSDFEQRVAAGNVPAFNYMILPNDHTNGTTKDAYSPQALIADNDLALGQIVDEISHSSIWKSSAIFVVEDDTQDGADHVDAHRMPSFVISPWARRHAVVHTRYDQYSALRTAELIVGLKPLALNDALATPMYDAFARTADVGGTRYTAVQPSQPLNEINGAKAADVRLSNALPFDRLDQVPQAVLDRILWHSVHGQASRPPAPGPNASPLEHERAAEALRAFRAHRSVRRALSAADGDG